MADKAERSPWHGKKRTTRQTEADARFGAWNHLTKDRDADTADLIRFHAYIAASVASKPKASLTTRERQRAHRLAEELERLVRPVYADALIPALLKSLADSFGKPMTPTRGRQREPKAWFVWSMLRYGAGELAALGQAQLTATELIAAACEVGLPGVEWCARRGLLDDWRKLRKKNLPQNPAALLAEAREQIEKKKAEEKAEAERRRMENERSGRAARLAFIDAVRRSAKPAMEREFFRSQSDDGAEATTSADANGDDVDLAELLGLLEPQ